MCGGGGGGGGEEGEGGGGVNIKYLRKLLHCVHHHHLKSCYYILQNIGTSLFFLCCSFAGTVCLVKSDTLCQPLHGHNRSAPISSLLLLTNSQSHPTFSANCLTISFDPGLCNVVWVQVCVCVCVHTHMYACMCVCNASLDVRLSVV